MLWISHANTSPSFGDPWADPRATLLVRDAFGFLEENPGQFDVIISDTTDPIGMAERLFSDEFYKLMVRALVSRRRCSHTMRTAFLRYRVDQDNLSICQSIDQESCLLLCQYPHLSRWRNWLHVCLRYTLGEWIKDPSSAGVNNYINPEIHKAAFALPEFFRRELYE